MSAPTDIEKPTGQRLASQYKVIERKELERSQYPCTLNSSSASIHDLAYHQSILGNEDNFAEQTTCSIFDVNGDGVGFLKPEVHDDELRCYIQAWTTASILLALTNSRLESNAPQCYSHYVSSNHVIVYHGSFLTYIDVAASSHPSSKRAQHSPRRYL